MVAGVDSQLTPQTIELCAPSSTSTLQHFMGQQAEGGSVSINPNN